MSRKRKNKKKYANELLQTAAKPFTAADETPVAEELPMPQSMDEAPADKPVVLPTASEKIAVKPEMPAEDEGEQMSIFDASDKTPEEIVPEEVKEIHKDIQAFTAAFEECIQANDRHSDETVSEPNAPAPAEPASDESESNTPEQAAPEQESPEQVPPVQVSHDPVMPEAVEPKPVEEAVTADTPSAEDTEAPAEVKENVVPDVKVVPASEVPSFFARKMADILEEEKAEAEKAEEPAAEEEPAKPEEIAEPAVEAEAAPAPAPVNDVKTEDSVSAEEKPEPKVGVQKESEEEDSPTFTDKADDAPVGVWIHDQIDDPSYIKGYKTIRACTCSICGYHAHGEMPICYSCGSRMVVGV